LKKVEREGGIVELESRGREGKRKGKGREMKKKKKKKKKEEGTHHVLSNQDTVPGREEDTGVCF